MNPSARTGLVPVAALAMAGSLAACTPSRNVEPPPLVIGRVADAIALDPARVTDAESVEVCEQIFEHLLRIDDEGNPEPALAERWEHSEGGTEWIFHLRHGVRFHDGTPLDADAVVFSFERQRDPKHPAHLGDFTHPELMDGLLSVEKVDSHTVRLRTRKPYAALLADLAMYPLSIVSPDAVTRFGAEVREHPVGTGPFRFIEWKRGERITLAANDDYWGGAPTVRHVAFVPVSDARQRLVKLEGGAIDVAEALAPQDLQFVTLHPALRSKRVAAQNVAFLAMNTHRPPFDDVRVRRAVALAIDRPAIVRFVYQGLAEVAAGALPPSMWGHVERAVPPPDTEKARQLLAEAGWRNGVRDRPKLYVPSAARPYMPAPVRLAHMIAQDLRDIGMDVEVLPLEMSDLLRRTGNGEHELCVLGGTSDNGDPDNVLRPLLHSTAARGTANMNSSFVADTAIDALLDEAREQLERPRREALYQRVQILVDTELPLLPIAHSQLVVAYRHEVDGLRLPPTATLGLREVRVERP